jgi:2-amino-4-hydroxy-6-hydroxymethyldihydropteridine diphosphokinase
MPAMAYLGLGSNLGDRLAICRRALAAIDRLPETLLVARSAFYETEPQERTDQPWFINAVAAVQTDLEPRVLLAACQQIERDLGRRREAEARFGPRALDLDLLLYNGLVLDADDLTLPHPRLHQRRFVLAPLAELAPALRHPTFGRTIAELLADLGAVQTVRRLDPDTQA